MGYIFDGVNKVISLTSGTTELDVMDLYSRWKDWVNSGEGAKYLPAFYVVGGEPIDEARGIYITVYYFLINGWRIKPQEANHRLKVVNGIILTDTGDSPFISTVGNYNILVEYSQPIKTETAVFETGVSGLTPEEAEALLMIRQVRDILLGKL